VAQTRHLLAPSGVWVAQKGQRPEAEMAKLDKDIQVFHVEPVTVPGLSAERCLVWMRKVT
jgi:16S rRNA (guanine527-N7)-methyltransferase